MALATAPLRATVLAAAGGAKRFGVLKRSQDAVGTADKSALFTVKFNPDWAEGATPGVAAAVATVEVDATNIILDVDGVLDRNIAHSGLTVQQMIDAINATESDNTNRWRAGLADAAPDVVAVPSVQAELDAMLGYLGGVRVSHELLETVYVGIGSDESERGGGYRIPDGFNALYSYPLDPAANPGEVGRGGGIDANQGEDILPQRRSAFRQSPALLAREINPSRARFLTTITDIYSDIVVPDGGNPDVPIEARIFDGEGTLVWSEVGNAAPPVHYTVPNVTVQGPAYVTVSGDGSGADNSITAGNVTVEGTMRRA